MNIEEFIKTEHLRPLFSQNAKISRDEMERVHLALRVVKQQAVQFGFAEYINGKFEWKESAQ